MLVTPHHRQPHTTPAHGRLRIALSRIVPVALAGTLLAACSVIPPQAVTDPLGLDGQQLALAFAGAAPTAVVGDAAFGAQAVAGNAVATFDFQDRDFDLPISPGTLNNGVSIALASLAPATDVDAPATITLSDPVLTARLWQGAASYETAAEEDRVEAVLAPSGDLVLTRGTCFAGKCNYGYVGEAAFGAINLSGIDLSRLLDLALQAPTPNHGSLELEVQAEPDALAGKTLTITIDAAEGTIGF